MWFLRKAIARRDTDRSDQIDHSQKFLSGMRVLAVVGCLVILIYSFRFSATGDSWRIFAVGILVAGAALLSGFLLGFIFAVPRVGDSKGKATANRPEGIDASISEGRDPLFNANLLEISDWLTKILVGVGLVELKSIPTDLGTLSYDLAPGLQPVACPVNASCAQPLIVGQAAGMAIIIFYFTLGFLMGWIWTMVFLRQDLLKGLKDKNRILDLIVKAEAALADGDLDAALSYANQAIESDPKSGGAVIVKGRVLKRKADKAGYRTSEGEALLNQALVFADQAVALLPGIGEPLYNKACYLALLGANPKEVVANLKSAFRLKPALRQVAASPDPDLASVTQDADFINLMSEGKTPGA